MFTNCHRGCGRRRPNYLELSRAWSVQLVYKPLLRGGTKELKCSNTVAITLRARKIVYKPLSKRSGIITSIERTKFCLQAVTKGGTKRLKLFTSRYQGRGGPNETPYVKSTQSCLQTTTTWRGPKAMELSRAWSMQSCLQTVTSRRVQKDLE